MNYKVICKCNIGEYPIFVRDVENEHEAEKEAKMHMLTDKLELGFFGVSKIIEI